MNLLPIPESQTESDMETDLSRNGEDNPAFAQQDELLRIFDLDDSILGLGLDNEHAHGGLLFRALYDTWVDRGGYENGKPRNSVRQIKIWLGKARNVRSLETKLAGKTRLQKEDAENLIYIFYGNGATMKESQSISPFEEPDLERFSKRVANILFFQDQKYLILPLRQRNIQGNYQQKEIGSILSTENHESTRPSQEFIEELFRESDALITVSRERTIIGPNPAASMAAFKKAMLKLYDIDRLDNRRRALIWIVDVGARENTESAHNMFINMEILATQFRAVAIIEGKNSKDVWDWFRRRVIVLVGSLKRSEIDYCYSRRGVSIPQTKLDLSTFSGDRLLLEAIPPRWVAQAIIGNAFGHHEGKLWRRPTITAHVSLEEWDNLNHDDEVDQRKDLRYLFHSSVEPHPSTARVDEPRCVEIGQPGWRWSGGFRLACTAAFGRLGWEDMAVGRIEDWQEAVGQLRRHNFAVLKIEEFMRLSNLIAEMPFRYRGDLKVAPIVESEGTTPPSS